MEIRLWWLAVCLWLAATSVSAQKGDVKTAAQITANASMAVANEGVYAIMNDTISKRRAVQSANVLFRQWLMSRDMDERSSLGNFSKENRSYKCVIQQVGYLADNVEELLQAAGRHPENLWNYQQKVGWMMLTAAESVNKMIRLAMNSRVEEIKLSDFGIDLGSPRSGSALPGVRSGNKKDGANLLSQIDRVELIEECVGELRAMNRALRSVIWRLNTDVHWTYMFKQVSPYHYRRIRSLNYAAHDALERAKRFDPFN